MPLSTDQINDIADAMSKDKPTALMRQLTVTVELLEYDLLAFPTPKAPKVVYKSSRMFLQDDADPALAATKFLASRMGLKTEVEDD